MPQLTRCPHCKRELKIPDGAAGNLRCPLCQQVFAVRAAPARETVGAAAATGASSKLLKAPAATPTVTASKPPSSPGRVGLSRPPVPVHECPACKARLLPGVAACMECGY